MFTLQIRCKSDCVVTINLLDGAILAQEDDPKGETLNKWTLVTSGRLFFFCWLLILWTELKLAEALKQTALFLSLTDAIITNLAAFFFSQSHYGPGLYYDYTLLYPSKRPIKHCSITVRLLSRQDERHRRWESRWVVVSTCPRANYYCTNERKGAHRSSPRRAARPYFFAKPRKICIWHLQIEDTDWAS